jgi:ATP-dependent helicase HrpB
LLVLVMSVTLDGARVWRLIVGAPVIDSAGRAFPVTTRYLGRVAGARLEDAMADAILKALRAETGSILAFLPGQGEIRRVEDRLRDRLDDPNVIVAPLYGALDSNTQDQAIEAAPAGKRKVVLATSIAETSLTILGVRVVIDCGVARVPRFEPGVGITRLETVRVSRASADQRQGRAGRTEPGVCYRLWDEAETASLLPFADPEVRSADLAPMVLDCAEWGVTDPRTLAWLDAPTDAALDAAREELLSLGALDADGRITADGTQMRRLPLPPRLARMVMKASEHGAAREAAEIAALLVERGLGGNDTSLEVRLENFRRDRGRRAADMRRMADGWAASTRENLSAAKAGNDTELTPALLLALAYPDRIAKARGAPGQFLLANGRGAHLDATDALARAPYLAIAEMQGKAAATRILLAAAASEADITALAGDRIIEREELSFDPEARAVRARRVRRLDAIELASEPLRVVTGAETEAALTDGVTRLGVAKLKLRLAPRKLCDAETRDTVRQCRLCLSPYRDTQRFARELDGIETPHAARSHRSRFRVE